MFGFSQMMKQSGMLYYLIEGGFLLLGALLYVVSLLQISHMSEIHSNRHDFRPSFLRVDIQVNSTYMAPPINSFTFW